MAWGLSPADGDGADCSTLSGWVGGWVVGDLVVLSAAGLSPNTHFSVGPIL